MRIDGSLHNLILQQVQQPQTQGLELQGGNKADDFGQMLMDVLKEVNQSQTTAQDMNNAFLTGQPGVEIHDVKIAGEQASIAMALTIQVRNKVLEAYQELNRIQV